MSTSEQYTDDLNLEDITSGSTFSQNIENLEGLTSLHADQQTKLGCGNKIWLKRGAKGEEEFQDQSPGHQYNFLSINVHKGLCEFGSYKMSFPDFIDISSDEETETTEVKDVKPILLSRVIQENTNYELSASQADLEEYYVKQTIQEQISCNIVNGASYDSYLTHRGTNPTDGLCPTSSSHSAPVALSRQFWKSGEYEAGQTLAPVSQNYKNRLRIHPKFLHSNATSHKWAFGAIAELLDNAVDEVQNGATFVIVDKFTNPRNGEAALLVHDDGGGMDPESLRRCMSFGFSDKQSDATIGQYGNGFKTSTMRLGADVIVFSRCLNKTVLTQSIGLLSYTFLRQTGCDDIVVPVVDYEFDPLTGVFARLLRNNEKQFSINLSTLLRWSPFALESELLEQFNDIGDHGTKVIVFNLWYNDDGDMEIDFESDPKDILINKTKKKMGKSIIAHKLTQNNVASRLQYSLRAYSSILYLRVPETFKIILRGEVVMQHHVVSDLIYLECVVYRPQVEGYPEVLTTVGFLEGAPNVDVHGFNVYHKNRLILPFWRVANNSYGKGRGVVGVLEANFIKPTHDKQDFEKSSIYQKLENRLKEMTYEYWDLHCHLIGYKSKKVVPGTSSIAGPAHQMPPPLRTSTGTRQAKLVNHGVSVSGTSQDQVVSDLRVPTDMIQRQLTIYNSQDQTSLSLKRKLESHISAIKSSKKQAVKSVAEPDGNHRTQLENSAERKLRREMKTMMLENTKLRKQCLELEDREKELLLKEEKLLREIRSFQQLYKKLSAELNSLDEVKVEKL